MPLLTLHSGKMRLAFSTPPLIPASGNLKYTCDWRGRPGSPLVSKPSEESGRAYILSPCSPTSEQLHVSLGSRGAREGGPSFVGTGVLMEGQRRIEVPGRQ